MTEDDERSKTTIRVFRDNASELHIIKRQNEFNDLAETLEHVLKTYKEDENEGN